jgi:hypothetical protein
MINLDKKYIDDIKHSIFQCCGRVENPALGWCESWDCETVKNLVDEIEMMEKKMEELQQVI